jgi:hypothetical protein
MKSLSCGTGKTHKFKVRSLVRFRLVDVYGEPVPETDVKIGATAQPKQSCPEAIVQGRDIVRASKVKTANGRRVMFGGYAYHRPEPFDPTVLLEGQGVDAYAIKNDICTPDDDHHDDDPDDDPDDDGGAT